MKNLIALLILLVLGSTQLLAQDTLYRVDGRVSNVRIIEVNNNQVKYRNPEGQGGPLFVLNRMEVLKIVYSDGKTEKFNANATTLPGNLNYSYGSVWSANVPKPDPLRTNFKRRYVNLNVTDYFAGAITLGYEYFTKDGDYSLRIPVSIGLNSLGASAFKVRETEYEDRQSYYRENKKFSTGFECYYYPYGQGKVRYYFGPAIEIGWFDYTDEIVLGSFPYTLKDVEMNGTFQSVLVHQGVLFQPTAEINFNIGIGFGYCQSRFRHQDADGIEIASSKRGEFAARYMLTVGYKFD
jgi:hypothetical protein